ncbi:hypothetical protein ACFQMF_03675 [Halorubrum rutilum]|uniref:Major facilitator superfamily (MFS) profile domain-containing protein n=1 Tax=Halorubrum rutilum TaxID=1364933 RepID=A0ABD6AHL0_9EURY
MPASILSDKLDTNDLWAVGGVLTAFGGALTVILGLVRDETAVVMAGSAAMLTSASVLLLVTVTTRAQGDAAG